MSPLHNSEPAFAEITKETEKAEPPLQHIKWTGTSKQAALYKWNEVVGDKK